MAMQIRQSGDPLANAAANQFNALKREITKSFTSNPHADVTSSTSGDARPPGSLVTTPLSVAGSTSTLAGVVAMAESIRQVLFMHFADTFAHQVADTATADLDAISYEALAPLLATPLPLSATATGSGATYAPVTAGHTLTLSINGQTYVVTFTGTEATQAAFHAVINAALPYQWDNGPVQGYARNASGQTMIVGRGNARTGVGGYGSIVSGSSDVLTSLGLTAATALVPITVVTQPATQSQANALLNALQGAYNGHRVIAAPQAHYHNDTINVSSAAAASSLSTSQTLAADLQTQVNAHILFGFATASLQVTPS